MTRSMRSVDYDDSVDVVVVVPPVTLAVVVCASGSVPIVTNHPCDYPLITDWEIVWVRMPLQVLRLMEMLQR